MQSTMEHLAKYNVTLSGARTFVLSHLNNPQHILNVAKQFQISNQMLADIVGNVSAQTVIHFFNQQGLDSKVLDPVVPPKIQLATSTVDTVTVPSINLQQLRREKSDDNKFVVAHSFGDFNGDGHTDVIMAPGLFKSLDKQPLEILLNDGRGNFSFDQTLIQGSRDGGLHPRKIVISDFNGDGKDDVLIADHGFDAPPFPGAAPIYLLSSDQGLVPSDNLQSIVGFHHSVAAGDIDNDGDQDAFFTRDHSGQSFFLINDGQGNMTHNNALVPSETFNRNYYTSELVDVDKDGHLDLLLAGHENEGVDTVIYWGSEGAGFSNGLKTVMPKAPSGHQIVVDIDVADLNGDGANDIIYNRVGSGPEFDFYGKGGAYLQILFGKPTDQRSFVDVSHAAINNQQVAQNIETWAEWIRLADKNNDGHLDIYVDDSHKGTDALVFFNNGAGIFNL